MFILGFPKLIEVHSMKDITIVENLRGTDQLDIESSEFINYLNHVSSS